MIGIPKLTRWRSEKHRRNVASLACVACGHPGPSQCAHANFGKGFGVKADDSMTFPLCALCHAVHDQSGILKARRRRLEVVYVDATRAELIARSLWTPETEAAYRRAYEPMKQIAEIAHGR